MRNDRPGKAFRLVGDDGKAEAGPRALFQRLHRAGQQRRAPRQVVAVERVHPRHQRRQRLGIQHPAARGQRPLHQLGDAVADHPPHLVDLQRRVPLAVEQLVGRRRDVGNAVDQRAVEIEKQGLQPRCILNAQGTPPCRFLQGAETSTKRRQGRERRPPLNRKDGKQTARRREDLRRAAVLGGQDALSVPLHRFRCSGSAPGARHPPTARRGRAQRHRQRAACGRDRRRRA